MFISDQFLLFLQFFCKEPMAFILLTDMDPLSSNPTTLDGGPHSEPDLSGDHDPKQETETVTLTIHLYHLGKTQGGSSRSEDTLTFPPGEYVAEELCITAAKTCGESH